MSNQKHIENEVEATLSLLDEMRPVKSPIDFENGALNAWKKDTLASRDWKRSMLLRAAAITAFIAMNSYVLVQRNSYPEQESSNSSQTFLDEYGLDWEPLSYE